jgi:hypothetical protein
MSFMQELAGYWFSQTKLVTLSKFPHPADGITPSPGIGMLVVRQLRKLTGLQFDDHNSTLRSFG